MRKRLPPIKPPWNRREDLTTRLRGKNYQKLDSNPNITVIDGTASFQSPHVVEVEKDGKTFQVEGEQIFINTGSSAFIPPIEGLKGNPYVYTSEGLLNLTELPSRLVIIGGGYIGVEFSFHLCKFWLKSDHTSGWRYIPSQEDEEIAGAVRGVPGVQGHPCHDRGQGQGSGAGRGQKLWWQWITERKFKSWKPRLFW